MQQRLSNQWLSDELIDAVSQNIRSERERASTNAYSAPPSPLRSQHRRRHFWLRIATALLLMGSAAFSYLAWSQSDRALREPNRSLQGVALAPAGSSKEALTAKTASPTEVNATTPVTPWRKPGTQSPQAGSQARVNALREKNRELRLRIAQLTAIVETPGP